MSRKKITDLTEATTAKTDHYIPVDHETDGTQKMSMSTLVEAVNEAAQGEGLTQTEKNLILDLFEKAAYADDDASTKYEALKTLWTGYSVTWNGSGFSKSNNASGVTAGDTFTSTIAANTGKTIESVTVTMGGTTVTGAYSSGTVTIPNVTGDIVITVETSQITVSSISAVYTQTGTVYSTDSLDSLKNDLVVTATFADSSTGVIPSTDYTLSGTLTEGTSTITVSYGGKTTTFTVTVSSNINYVAVGNPTITNGILTVENGKYVRSNYALSPTSGQAWKIRQKFKYNTKPTGFVNIIGGSDADAFAKTFVVQENTNHQYIMYFSADMSAWTVSNQYTDNMPLAVDTWYYFEIGYTGTKYYMELKTGGWDGTRVSKGYKETTSNVLMYGGKYVGFGVTSTVSGFDGQIDLNDCSIYVDDVLVWQAIAS